MARPSDWSALGLSADPTPGDPDEIDRVISSQYAQIELADTIDTGLNGVLDTASQAFKGKTADAVRGKIDGRVRGFITSFKKAHQDVRGILQTYVGVMREQQGRADAALRAAQSLKEDDKEGREAQKSIAEDARKVLEAAAATAATGLTDAADSISSPVDECKEFFQALTWLAMLLIIPAIFVGGPLALAVFALNLAILIKTAVDFSHGEASVLDLVLAVVGVIAPTTKGLNLRQAWSSLKGIGARGFQGAKNLVLGGPNSLGLFTRVSLGLDHSVTATGTWVRGGVFSGIKFNTSGIQGIHLFGGAGRGFSFFPIGVELAVINGVGAKAFFGVRSLMVGLNGVKDGVLAVARGLGGWKGLRLFLPVASDEMGNGILLAFRIGFIDRGLFGKFRYGAFINGKFLGDISKISGVAAGGSHFFGGAGNGGLHLIRPGDFSFSSFDNPFTGNGLGGLGHGGFSSIGQFGAPPPGISVIIPDNLDLSLGSLGALGGIGRVDLPPIGARLVDLPNLGAFDGAPLPQLGPITPIESLGATPLPSLGTVPQALPLNGHLTMPQLGAPTGSALPSLGVHAPALDSFTGALVPVNVSTPSLPSVGHVSVPSLGSVGGGEIGLVKTGLPGIDAKLVDLPAVDAAPQLGTVQLGQVNVPAQPGSVELGHLATPSLGTSVPASLSLGRLGVPQTGAHLGDVGLSRGGTHLGGTSVPDAQTHLGDLALPQPATQLGQVGVPQVQQLGGQGLPGTAPGLGRSPSTAPSPGQLDVPVTRTGAVNLGTLGRTQVPPTVPNVSAPLTPGQISDPAVDAQHVDIPTVLPENRPGPGGTGHTPALTFLDDLLAAQWNQAYIDAAASSFRRHEIFVNHTVTLDFQHTFTHLPGLPGVRVQVDPGLASGRTVDIQVHGAHGVGGTIDARHLRIGDQNVLRIEHLRTDGTIHRLDYALSAQAGHGLLDEQVIDVHVTGDGPAGHAREMQPLPPPGHLAGMPGSSGTSGTSGAPGTVRLPGGAGLTGGPATTGAGGAVPAPVVPVVHAVTPPGLTGGAHVDIRVDPRSGAITDVRAVPGGAAPFTVRHLPGGGPGGVDIVRVEQTVVPHVETRRWNYTADAHGNRLLGIERRFQLSGGPLDGTTVSLDMNAAQAITGIRHLGAGDAVLPTGGRPVQFNNAVVNVPDAHGSGFHLYDPATGGSLGTGIALTGPGGAPNGLHVLTPTGLPGGAAGPLPPLRLTAADGVTTLGTVTSPANGVFHVVPAPAAGAAPVPHLSVYRTDGTFSHHALPVPTVTLAGGAGHAFVQLPDGPGAVPQLVRADGTAVPGATVTPQGPGGFRIDHQGGHVVVDPAGTHTHYVVVLGGPHVPAGGHFVFTPAGTPHAPLPQLRDAQGAVDPHAGQVARVDGTLHVDLGQNRFAVHTPQGVFSHDALSVTGLRTAPPGGAFVRDGAGPGGVPQLVRGDGTPVPGATVGSLGPDGFRIDHAGQHVAVNPAGAHTHDVVTLHGPGLPAGGGHVFSPLPGTHLPGPQVRGADGTVDASLTVQRAGGAFRITDPHGVVRGFHATTGAHVDTHVPLSGGTGLDGHFVRTDTHGNVTLTRPDLRPFSGGGLRVVEQTGMPGGGFRVEHNGVLSVVDAHGVRTHTPLELRGPTGAGTGTYVFQPIGAGAAPHPQLKDPAGADLPDGVTVRPDGSFQAADTRTIRVHDAADGRLQFTAYRLTDATGAQVPETIAVFRGGGIKMLDHHLDVMDGTTVTVRPGGGFRAEGAGGEFRLYDGAGRLEMHAVPNPAGTSLTVTPTGGAAPFHVVPLRDAVTFTDPSMARFVATTGGPVRLLDGNLNAVTTGTVSLRHGTGGFRVDGPGGLRAGEFKLYAADGTLDHQRINIVHEGRIKPQQYLELHHTAQPGAGGAKANTWRLVRTDVTGVPLAHQGLAKWFEGGLINPKGLEHGRVHLTTFSGTTVFEQRPLPSGHTLGAFQSTASADAGGWSLGNQRGFWHQLDAAGNSVRFGKRHWGESGRSWFDVETRGGIDYRVLHFQQNPDGGHTLGTIDSTVWTQGSAQGAWTRFDADFKVIAQGTRAWGPGRGFTDKMLHPLTGDSVLMHEKFGRFQTHLHDVRRFFQREIGADGLPKDTKVSLSAPGKEIDSLKLLENGLGYLKVQRVAEQRPPRFFRYLLSSEYRATDLGHVKWLQSDTTPQLHEWKVVPSPDSTHVTSHGVRFLPLNGGGTLDIAGNGQVVRETRKLFHGNDLTVGNVKLPDAPGGAGPVHTPAGYLPWSEGPGKLQGHRTFVRADFQAPAGVDVNRIVWQDRFTTNLHDGDWFSPNAAKNWQVARTGFDDGTYVDYRPAPAVRPDGAAGSGDIGFRQNVHMNAGDWTRYDHNGFVVGRSDSWPHPTPGGPDLHITAHGPADGKMTWVDANAPHISGERLTANGRGVNRYGWDRESYWDFGPDGRLIREHRLLADGTTVDGWRVSRDAAGVEVWHWQKVDLHGNIKEFGTGPGDRIRVWYDRNGVQLNGWEKGARWSDRLTSLPRVRIQEIPAKPHAGLYQNAFGDAPFRVREFVPDPGGAFSAHTWKEFDTGAVVRQKKLLENGTFLEIETWQKHWRQYDPTGMHVIAERAPSGYTYEMDTFGRWKMIGRETNWIDLANDYRGYHRMLKETNRWEFGPSVGGESTYRPYLTKAGQQLLVETGHEAVIDFALNLLVLGIAAAVARTAFTGEDVLKALWGAFISSGTKGLVIGAHQAYGRGTPWRLGWGHVDYGFPFQRHPSDDDWAGEWAGHDKVTRWRGGTYDFLVGIATGVLSGFVNGAGAAAIFGVKNQAGQIVKLVGRDAALAGAMSSVGGTIGGLSIGALRTLVQQNLAGRVYHRGGVVDIFVFPMAGKLIDKSFGAFFMSAKVRDWFNPGWYLMPGPDGSSIAVDVHAAGNGTGTASGSITAPTTSHLVLPPSGSGGWIDTDTLPQGAGTP
ncbi:hypothetical protein [Streptomyces sp. WAC06614]|uniref:hypothetical protein n=1 Tax=Streptomyces sp. WAC06614 TaxID=2487416 RepID=UPI000F79C3C3|nr:hypothetical protein [Streptomyces sp. WAC06614]RSS78172.1 hypothetical protein EF918_21990 [Streptomyces sp. WAC06614]